MLLLKAECSLFTVLVLRETTQLTSFFISPVSVPCDDKKKEIQFMNVKERLISLQTVKGWNKALLSMVKKEGELVAEIYFYPVSNDPFLLDSYPWTCSANSFSTFSEK